MARVHLTVTVGVATRVTVLTPAVGRIPVSRFAWDFGDGGHLTGRGKPGRVRHVYRRHGAYRVMLKLYPVHGAAVSASTLVKVAAPKPVVASGASPVAAPVVAPPVAAGTSPPSPPDPQPVFTFDGQAAAATQDFWTEQGVTFTLTPHVVLPAGRSLAQLAVDWGDSSSTGQLTPPIAPSLSHDYASIGKVNVTMSATDTAGGSYSYTHEVDVADYTAGVTCDHQDPTTGVTGTTYLDRGDSLGCTWSFGDAGNVGAMMSTWQLDFGDGSAAVTGTGNPPTTPVAHVYATDGDYEVTTVETSDHGRTTKGSAAAVHVGDCIGTPSAATCS